MYCSYQDREELENELYQEEEEDDAEGSEVNSELEFHLYSQLHYSSNAGEMNTQEEGAEREHKGECKDAEWKDSEQSNLPSHDEDGLRQQLKGQTELNQREVKLKQKKMKGNSKGQRLSSSAFEEVIVIDSGTDVISISEDDTNDGVCALKGMKAKSRPLQSSTPAQQTTQKRKRSTSLDSVVILNSGNSRSESEEPGSESDSDSYSDDLENWMILGRGKRNEDCSIALNLEGDSDSNAEFAEGAEASWLISSKDKTAQIHNKSKGESPAVRRNSYRYYTDKNVTCRNCNKTGHLSKNCPLPKKVTCCFLCGTPGHQAMECPNKHCNNCGQPGHLYGSCSEMRYWRKMCHRCGMTGHFYEACPEIWRQYHITTKTGPPQKLKGEDLGRTPPYCYNCSNKGHFGHACTQRMMFNGTYPSTPFINYYDSNKDIWHRDQKLRWKINDLKENGLFPTNSQTPVTPGPPKKKQKTNKDWFTKKADKCKQQGTSTLAKPWKPKREVPVTRAPIPPAKPKKPVVNEDDDFPRGGGGQGQTKKKKKRKNKNAPAEAHGAPVNPKPHTPDRQSGTGPAVEAKRKKARNRGRYRKAANRAAAEMYPTDENLFIIKQRKRKR
ncbi:zinc finger CCHC domain-containing protein 7 [Polymixia lowei]